MINEINWDSIIDSLNPYSRKNRINQIKSILSEKLNTFTDAIIDSEDKIKTGINEASTQKEIINRKLEQFDEPITGVPTQEYINYQDEIFDHHYDSIILNEYLTSMAEMKIVFLFKTVEIRIKNAIKAGYAIENETTYDRWGWREFKPFLQKLKPLDKFIGFQETDQLRILNNAIKHSGSVLNDVANIEEFKDQKEFTPEKIDLFLTRVTDKVAFFLEQISDCLCTDVFEFSVERLKKLSKEYSMRMDDETLILFIETLTSFVKK